MGFNFNELSLNDLICKWILVIPEEHLDDETIQQLREYLAWNWVNVDEIRESSIIDTRTGETVMAVTNVCCSNMGSEISLGARLGLNLEKIQEPNYYAAMKRGE